MSVRKPARSFIPLIHFSPLLARVSGSPPLSLRSENGNEMSVRKTRSELSGRILEIRGFPWSFFTLPSLFVRILGTRLGKGPFPSSVSDPRSERHEVLSRDERWEVVTSGERNVGREGTATRVLFTSVPLSRSVHRSFGSHLVHRRCRGAGRRDGPNEMNGETERR